MLHSIDVLGYDMFLHSTYLGKNTNRTLYGKVYAQTVWFSLFRLVGCLFNSVRLNK